MVWKDVGRRGGNLKREKRGRDHTPLARPIGRFDRHVHAEALWCADKRSDHCGDSLHLIHALQELECVNGLFLVVHEELLLFVRRRSRHIAAFGKYLD